MQKRKFLNHMYVPWRASQPSCISTTRLAVLHSRRCLLPHPFLTLEHLGNGHDHQVCLIYVNPSPTQVSKYLREYALNYTSKSQLFIKAFAKALEVIPRQLCNNAGFDATDVLNKLRQKHALPDQAGKVRLGRFIQLSTEPCFSLWWDGATADFLLLKDIIVAQGHISNLKMCM